MSRFQVKQFSNRNTSVCGIARALSLAVGILLAGNAHAKKPQTAAASGLQIVVENIVGVEGPIMLQVLAGEAGFNGKVAPVASMILPAQHGSIAVYLDRFPPGDYAIRVMHDIDGDGELESNILGMPKEPWGMSNNASGSFGPPSWQDARFTVPSQTPQIITLRHQSPRSK